MDVKGFTGLLSVLSKAFPDEDLLNIDEGTFERILEDDLFWFAADLKGDEYLPLSNKVFPVIELPPKIRNLAKVGALEYK